MFNKKEAEVFKDLEVIKEKDLIIKLYQYSVEISEFKFKINFKNGANTIVALNPNNVKVLVSRIKKINLVKRVAT